MKEQKEINKSFGKEQENSVTDIKNPFFKSVPLTNIPQLTNKSKIDRSLVYKKIVELAPINITALARNLPYSRSSVYYAVLSLENAQFIETRIILKDNHAERLICIPDGKKMQLLYSRDESGAGSSSVENSPNILNKQEEIENARNS